MSEDFVLLTQSELISPVGESTCQCAANASSICPLSIHEACARVGRSVDIELSKFVEVPNVFRSSLRAKQALVGHDFAGRVLYGNGVSSAYSDAYSLGSESETLSMMIFFPGSERRDRAFGLRNFLVEVEEYSSEYQERFEPEDVSYSSWYEVV